MKTYGDEAFIRLIRERQEQSRNKDIQKGSIFIDGKEIVFREREIQKNVLWMWMPEEFSLLSEDMARLKYPNENRPELIYSNTETTVNISFSHQKEKMSAGRETEIRDYMEQVIHNLHPTAETIEKAAIRRTDGQDTAWFDFVTPAIDAYIYNMMFFTSVKGRLLLGSCNCLEQDQEEWKDLFFQMAVTMRVNE